jgi:O-acetyl-ADP-ribose deacetylase (regulator of RNase III)
MQIIEKDILTVDVGLIIHQCNCRGAFGKGLALSIKNKFPVVHKRYLEICQDHINSGEDVQLLGNFQIVPVKDNPPLRVVNAFTQYDYGSDGRCYTNYKAILEVFRKLKIVNTKNLPAYIPFGYGSGLGGGDWNVVMSTIESVYPEIIVCKK